MMIRMLTSAATLMLAVSVPAVAQTPVQTPVPTPAGTAPGIAPTTGTFVSRPGLPMPESVVWQAGDQQEGEYGYLIRPRSPGQVQTNWDDAKPNAATYSTDVCDDCTYKMRLREWMVSVIELPRGETIQSVDIGDANGFQVSKRGKSRLALRPIGAGYDSNLIIYGESGRIYPFYLRAEGFNSNNTPDVMVRLVGSVAKPTMGMAVAWLGDGAFPGGEAEGGPNGTTGPEVSDLAKAVTGLTETNPLTPPDDFVADAPFDPSTLRGWGEYELWGSDDSLKPETVFKDDHFTYLRFGDKWKDVELPTAYVVVDGIDELVNTRVQGQTYIVESTRPLITLKSGKSYLCIKYTGEPA